ncbi:hypothetical protein glysoja_030327 [Glycine soja]|uniref:Uncharacterized protein n=1 Tax=Glycine soja TaxID=3848 RepID=A0A0B2PAN6_GLYSO|nr:hypothetical protein JHK87_049227 [Glycine soja]KHN06261.1 hypothetical protein glysoja_030327 [Glycine soja]
MTYGSPQQFLLLRHHLFPLVPSSQHRGSLFALFPLCFAIDGKFLSSIFSHGDGFWRRVGRGWVMVGMGSISE